MTRKMMLIAGVAGLALSSGATAERGGRGGEQKAQQQQQQRAERPQRAERQSVQRAERPQMQRMERAERPQMPRIERAERPQMQRFERQQVQRVERPQIQRQHVQRVERPQRIERPLRQTQRVERNAPRVERAQRVERQQARVERPQRIERQQARVERREQQRVERIERVEQARLRTNREPRGDRIRVAGGDNRPAFRARAEARANGMPFRYGVHDMRAMKPMKSARLDRVIAVGERFNRLAATAAVPTYFASRYVDTPDYYYRYDDDYGYVYRVNRDNNFVSALIPLFGGYGIGDPWPTAYRSSYVPYGYQSLYYDTPDYFYRYDGYGLYQIDAKTQLISALVALISGNGYGVGQMLPSSYGVYNVPMAYRSSYYDRNDAWYRYGDGFIYQIDPYSRRIEERYPLYAGYDDYLVGERWPVAYPDYNVPYGYQSVYYDTPQYQYRYANDAIYQVDPTTQLITAVAALLSGSTFTVGQPLPAGYGVYNVPVDYRDRYYDTADNWYRYNNGYVYRVDPVTGLIEDSIPVYA
jgi:hypothetical protein